MQSREDFLMIKQLRHQGTYIVDIAHRIGCSERTVRRCLALPAPPTGRPKHPRASKLDPFKPYIDELLAQDVWNAEVIRQFLQERGYTGCITLVRRYIQPKRSLRAKYSAAVREARAAAAGEASPMPSQCSDLDEDEEEEGEGEGEEAEGEGEEEQEEAEEAEAAEEEEE